ncbi:hypothetical protein YYG_01650 [Plasmodium vinckei petteri]|uniref:Fam-a protein n=1 Tax=Plasmodium vinckei petteri TaxID=138298 RepID=W7AGW8_PLAVN|nr:hypothetical protein YYG_01650 [Plasmodium vinckei petteri]
MYYLNKTIISKASIDIYGNVSGDKKKGKKAAVESKSLSKDRIDWDNVARQIVLNNKFINEFGFVIERKSDNVAITYVEYNNHHKAYPKKLSKINCRGCKVKKYQI